MTDEIDLAADRTERETQISIQRHASRVREEPSAHCLECGDGIPERFALGYATCVPCQQAIERERALYSR